MVVVPAWPVWCALLVKVIVLWEVSSLAPFKLSGERLSYLIGLMPFEPRREGRGPLGMRAERCFGAPVPVVFLVQDFHYAPWQYLVVPLLFGILGAE
jgi:hypothetical protein